LLSIKLGHFGVQLAAGLEQLPQRSAVDKLHAEEICIALGGDIVDLHEVVMHQLRCGKGFFGEPGHKHGVAGPLGTHGLHGHVAV
jgi:hypothetical protein